MRMLIDTLLPPQCLSCRALVDRPGQLCAKCWSGIDFIDGACCAACGLPFDYEVGEGALCGACARRRPRYDRARAVFRYDDQSRGLILRFKYADQLEGAPSYGAWLARAGAELVREADLIAPVPLHRWRLLRRRFNQSAVLAHALGRQARKPVAADLLARTRATPSQGGLNFNQRRRNVRNAFAVHRRRAALVRGRRVLLVDDVLTTGSTVEACAKALLAAGASGVDVVVLARVVRGSADTI
jgi:ComF family protein